MEESKKASDMQIGGTYYTDMKIQPIDFIEDNTLSFSQGCVIKYICRYREKNGLQDLLKARHYIDLIIEREYGRMDSEAEAGEKQ